MAKTKQRVTRRCRKTAAAPNTRPERCAIIKFTGTVCLDEAKAASQPINIDGRNVCEDCFNGPHGIRSQFEAFLTSETQRVNWPASIGLICAQFFKESLTSYRQKLREYSIKLSERLYCSDCDRFLGTRSTRVSSRRCAGRSARCCAACGSKFEGSTRRHLCPISKEAQEQTFVGLRKGRDYQACPSCETVVTLESACDRMTCFCGTHFCYICGERALPYTGHWSTGKPCSLYNQPDDQNAQFEEPPMEDILEEMAMTLAENGLPGFTYDNGWMQRTSPEHKREIERREHQQELFRTALEANHREIDRSAMLLDVPEWLPGVQELALSLMLSLDLYTSPILADDNHWENRRDQLRGNAEDINESFDRAGDEGFEAFPRLRDILARYRIAVEEEEEAHTRYVNARERLIRALTGNPNIRGVMNLDLRHVHLP